MIWVIIKLLVRIFTNIFIILYLFFNLWIIDLVIYIFWWSFINNLFFFTLYSLFFILTN
jgi:hypothetical protein